MSKFAVRSLWCTAVIILVVSSVIAGSDQATLSKEQIKHFLLTAQVVGAHQSSKGVTHPFRLTLSDGKLTHDASFQGVEEHKQAVTLGSGEMERNFVDSYKYNLAAYALAELIGFDDMMPVYVERTWNGMSGSLSWWLPVAMDDQERYFRQIEPPNQERWKRQINKIRVFNQLVDDTDPNLTNIVIAQDWQVWRIDFTRAFRLHKNVQIPNEVRCERQMFEKLKRLDRKEVAARTKTYLTDSQVESVMARRDVIVAHFQRLIAENGEGAVLY